MKFRSLGDSRCSRIKDKLHMISLSRRKIELKEL